MKYCCLQMRDCRDAVDAVPDPNPKSRPTARVRGEAKSGTPKKFEQIHWGMRKWMINAEVLGTHQDWISSGLVLDNGVAWGDCKEPEVLGSKKRKVAVKSSAIGVGGPGPLTEHAREARRAHQLAQQRAVEVHGGETLEDLMMNLE